MKKALFVKVWLLIFCLSILLFSVNIEAKGGTQKWSFETGGSIVSSPSIGFDGTIYVGSNDGNLYAINSDGSLKWKFQTNGAVHSHPAIGPDGTIYVGSWDHNLYAINQDGSLKWCFPTKAEVNSSPTLGSDGTIYVGSWDHNLYAIKKDGSLKWIFLTEGQLFSTPAVGPDSTIYITSWDHNLYAINGSLEMDVISEKVKKEIRKTESPLRSKKISAEIKEIKFEVTPEGEEKVLFLLNGFNSPNIFILDGKRPRLVCDFFNTHLGFGIDNFIKIKSNLIRQIRIAFHDESVPKLRVVMDLESNKDCDTEQIYLKDENIFIITLNSDKRTR